MTWSITSHSAVVTASKGTWGIYRVYLVDLEYDRCSYLRKQMLSDVLKWLWIEV